MSESWVLGSRPMGGQGPWTLCICRHIFSQIRGTLSFTLAQEWKKKISIKRWVMARRSLADRRTQGHTNVSSRWASGRGNRHAAPVFVVGAPLVFLLLMLPMCLSLLSNADMKQQGNMPPCSCLRWLKMYASAQRASLCFFKLANLPIDACLAGSIKCIHQALPSLAPYHRNTCPKMLASWDLPFSS